MSVKRNEVQGDACRVSCDHLAARKVEDRDPLRAEARPVRFGQLRRAVPGPSKKVLTENLRDLENHRIIVRRDLVGIVRHVEYDFTEHMFAAFKGALDGLIELGQFHAKHK